MFYTPMGLAAFYSKIFGLGVMMGAGLEVMLIKSNYCASFSLPNPISFNLLIWHSFYADEVLAASEAKQRAKELQQEQEDLERFKRILSQQQEQSTNA